MPPNKPTGTVFTRHRKEILAVIVGAAAALGLWLFIGGPDQLAIGTGVFSSPARGGPGVGGEAMPATADSAAADSAATTGAPDTPTTGAAEAAVADARGEPAVADAAPAGSDSRSGEGPSTAGPAPLANVLPRERAGAESARASDDDAESESAVSAERNRAATPESVARAGAAIQQDRVAAPRRDAASGGTPAREPLPEPEAATDEAVPATAVEARVAAEVAVSRYARAVESGDLSALRRAHPGLTAESEAAWRRVFENGETFVAMLRITAFDANGSEARADVRGSCHFYDLSLRRFVDVPVDFRLFLHHDGRTWRPVLADGGSPGPSP